MFQGEEKMIKACISIPLAVLFLCLMTGVAAPNSVVIASYYRADEPFPEFSYFWQDSKLSEWGTEATNRETLGGSIHVFLRNPDTYPLEVQDVFLQGVSLKQAIAFSTARKFKRSKIQAANIHFSNLPKTDMDTIIAAGEPIWWRVEPSRIEPKGLGEITVRLRRTPKEKNIDLAIKFAKTTVPLSIPVSQERPRVESITFSPDLKQIFLYASHPRQGITPARVLLDGTDISSGTIIGKDSRLRLFPIVCSLKSPLAVGSFHIFNVQFKDGSSAIAGIRAYADELRYGMWGARPGKETELEVGRAWLQEMTAHNINLQMEMLGSAAVAQFMKSEEGRQMMHRLGIKRVVGEPEKDPSPHSYYLADEPDAADSRVPDVPSQAKVGSLAQGLVQWAEQLRQINPSVPTMVNVDMTYKPDNWYIYGQVADIYAADPYYQTRLAEVYFSKPHLFPCYTKATFVYAVGRICRSACAPKPLHLILNCTRRQDKDRKFRFATPAEKRIEVFYALGAGAKQLSYWWFVPLPPNAEGSAGLATDDPDAQALWREIGILGAEVRTAGPLIIRSCPADLNVSCSKYLWVRPLLSGTDSILVLCVNDDYACDRLGSVYKPIENAEVSLTVPSWLKPRYVFEINARGIQEVKWDQSQESVTLHLGTVDLTRLVVITSDRTLAERLQDLYNQRFKANVETLFSEQTQAHAKP